MSAFAVYCRASEEGAGGLSSNPDEQEAYARAWAASQPDVEVVEVLTEIASGALAASDRKLGELISRCESGELTGIIVRDEKRFARDTVAGGVALARLNECGARLVATWTGFDSSHLTPESQMLFNIMLSVGQAELERNRERRISAKLASAERGVWCSATPLGYDKDDTGRLVPNDDAETVRTIFKLRAQGLGFSEIASQLPEVTLTHTRLGRSNVGGMRVRTKLTRSGIYRAVRNRAYRGEQVVPVKQKNQPPRVLTDNHPAIVTEQEWQAANAVKGRAPIRRGLSEHVNFKGLIRCGTCGAPMSVLSYGANREKLTYACTRRNCGKASMAVSKIEPLVAGAVYDAIMDNEPHVAAALAEDGRYEVALAAVEQAQTDLAAFRDNLEVQRLLGIRDFAAGIKARQDAVELARRALRETPRPPAIKRDRSRPLPVHSVVNEVLVYPKTAPHRLTLRWVGAAEPIALEPAATDAAAQAA